MNWHNRISLAALVLAAAAVAPLAAQTWTPLFDGKSLSGWKQVNGTASYEVKDGAIVGTTAEGSPNSFLATTRDYGDFELAFEVLVDPVLNSGVQIRSHQYQTETEVITENRGARRRSHPAGRVYGYQVEIADEKRGVSGGIYDEARRGWIANIEGHPVASKAFKDNRWNQYTVEAVGDRIRTFVNGVPCADLVDPVDQEGFIALQVHQFKGEKPAQVRWRNIRIRDLGRHVWKPIWDGKSLAGWTRHGGGDWAVVDGAIRGTQAPGAGKQGFLVSDTEHSDFTMRLKYRIRRGNSGVFFRMGNPGDRDALGYEVEVDPTRDAGGLQAPGTRNWLVHTGRLEETPFYRPGDWNEMAISAHGGRIVVHINGKKTAELRDDPGRRSGRVALQLDAGQDLEVWYKDIEVLVKAQ